MSSTFYSEQGEKLIRDFNEKNKNNQKLMKNVSTTNDNVFRKNYVSGDLDFSQSQLMHNHIQEIIDSSREFCEMLKKSAEARNVCITEDESEHINENSIPSNLAELCQNFPASSSTRSRRK